ncbi:unnamed protein product [Lampetra fluviatilis]
MESEQQQHLDGEPQHKPLSGGGGGDARFPLVVVRAMNSVANPVSDSLHPGPPRWPTWGPAETQQHLHCAVTSGPAAALSPLVSVQAQRPPLLILRVD